MINDVYIYIYILYIYILLSSHSREKASGRDRTVIEKRDRALVLNEDGNDSFFQTKIHFSCNKNVDQ